jgi:hypothetical protein
MLARFRSRLTYANVVATLALFIALGGTSFAVSKLTGRDIKNRSITRVDLRKNTLTGTEINESRLRTVPRARRATSATNAITASNALIAGQANLAKNSDALGGQGVTSFEKSSKTQFGKAVADPAGEPGEQAVLSWPEMGVQLTSATNQGACGGDPRIAVVNTKASGPGAQAFETQSGSLGTVAAGSKGYFCSTTPSGMSGAVTDSTGRALFFNCIIANGELRCLGIRSEP